MQDAAAAVTAVRMTRSAPLASLSVCAAAAGTSPQRLRRQLARLTPRGLCAQLAATATGHDQRREVRAVGMSHRACPPGCARAGYSGRAVSSAGRGTAGWSARNPRGERLAEAAAPAAHKGYGPSDLWNPVAWTDAAPRSVLAVLAASKDPHQRAAAARSVACPSMLLTGLTARTDLDSGVRSGDLEPCTAVAVNGRCPPWVLARLLGCSTNVDNLAAEHPRCPGKLLDAVIENPPNLLGLRACAVSNPNCSDTVLRASARSEYSWITQGAASNPNYPPEMLYEAAESSDPYTVGGAAANPNSPPELLRRIAERASSYESFTPDDTESRRDILERIAQNPHCPPELLRQILSDNATRYATEKVANNPACPPDLLPGLASLGGGRHEEVRRAVAAHPRTPIGTLAGLADDESGNVRRAVAANSNTPTATLAELVWSSDTAVSLTAAVTLSRAER